MSRTRIKRCGLIICLGLSVISSIGLLHSVSQAHAHIGASQSLEGVSGTINWQMENASAAEATADMLYDIFTWIAFMVIVWGIYFGVKLIRSNGFLWGRNGLNGSFKDDDASHTS